MRLCITGANSSVGRNLLQHVTRENGITAVATARSPAALASLPAAGNIEKVAARYQEVGKLAHAFQGADSVIHLAGVLFVSKANSYRSANVDSTAAVVAAAQQAGVKHVLFISVLGADAASMNPFFRSKGEAEQLVLASGLAATIMRTPILLGPDSAGGQALLREANSGTAKLLGGGRHEVQPLDVDDLSRALLHACRHSPVGSVIYELTGPERVPYNELVKQMAARLGRDVKIASIPVGVAKVLAGVSHALKGAGMSPAIIDVITTSESVRDNAAEALHLTLTPLAETLDKLAASGSERSH